MTDAAASLADIAMSQTMDHKLVTPAEIQWEPGPGVLPSSICLNEEFSADEVRHHKPSRAAYAHVEKGLGVEPSQLCLVACHTWDTLGAIAAGWRAALIKRVGNDLLGVGPQPEIVGQ